MTKCQNYVSRKVKSVTATQNLLLWPTDKTANRRRLGDMLNLRKYWDRAILLPVSHRIKWMYPFYQFPISMRLWNSHFIGKDFGIWKILMKLKAECWTSKQNVLFRRNLRVPSLRSWEAEVNSAKKLHNETYILLGAIV